MLYLVILNCIVLTVTKLLLFLLPLWCRVMREARLFVGWLCDSVKLKFESITTSLSSFLTPMLFRLSLADFDMKIVSDLCPIINLRMVLGGRSSLLKNSAIKVLSFMPSLTCNRINSPLLLYSMEMSIILLPKQQGPLLIGSSHKRLFNK